VSAVLEALRAGRERVARGWTQRGYACDANGNDASPASSLATCWCALGGIYANSRQRAAHDAAVVALMDAMPPGAGHDVAAFNDATTTTQADVLALYDRAIAAQEAP